MALLRSKSYLQLLVLAGLIGVPVSVVAYWFLKLVAWLQHNFFETIPKAIGFAGTPAWWPLPLLAVSGILVGATITYLPGTSGHEPSEGSKPVAPHKSMSFPGSSWPPLPP
jgi:H+/Cl- antiporter ClcA